MWLWLSRHNQTHTHTHAHAHAHTHTHTHDIVSRDLLCVSQFSDPLFICANCPTLDNEKNQVCILGVASDSSPN
jgi:hypothetical protein